MSAWLASAAAAPILAGDEGELVSVSVATDPRTLEGLLECLASVSFPINPELFHGVPTVVEFPAYEHGIRELREALKTYGFDPAVLTVRRMIEKLSASPAAG